MAQIIWTKHLQERIKQRQISPSLVEKTIHFPDRIENCHTTNSQKHIKNFGSLRIVAAVKRQGNDWIVTSVWKDYDRPGFGYKKPFLERLVYSFVLWLEKVIRSYFNR